MKSWIQRTFLAVLLIPSMSLFLFSADIETSVSLSPSFISIQEGSARESSVLLSVNRIGNLTQATRVFVRTVNGTAQEGVDFDGLIIDHTFASGETSFDVSVNLIGDLITDAVTNKKFAVTIQSPNALVQAPDTTEVTIIDDDAAFTPDPGQFSFELTPSSTLYYDERSSDIKINVSREKSSAGKAEGAVKILLEPLLGRRLSAKNTIDYEFINDSVTFSPDEVATKSFQIHIINDLIPEPDESIEFKWSTQTSAELDGVSVPIANKPPVIVLRSDDIPNFSVGEPIALNSGETFKRTISYSPNFEKEFSRFEKTLSVKSGPVNGLLLAQSIDDFTIKANKPGTYLLNFKIGVGFDDYKESDLLVTVRELADTTPEGNLIENMPESINKFNASNGQQAKFNFKMDSPGHVDIKIYDRFGKTIKEVINSDLSSGVQSIPWDGHDDEGNMAAAGIYTAILKIGGGRKTMQILLIK